MKNILIVSVYYDQYINPRTHRWQALATYFAAHGCHVHVLTSCWHDHPAQSVEEGIVIHRTGFDSLKSILYRYLNRPYPAGTPGGEEISGGTLLRILLWLHRYVWRTICYPDYSAVWYFPARKRLRHLLSAYHYDAIISVSLPITGHLPIFKIKKDYPGIWWLADCGDPFLSPDNSFAYQFLHKKRLSRLEQKLFCSADIVTVTNDGVARHYERLGFSQAATNKLHVIPPLLHPFYPWVAQSAKKLPDIIKICFAGIFSERERRPDALADLLRRTHISHPALYDKLRLDLVGALSATDRACFDGLPNIRFTGVMTRVDARNALSEADFLLNIGMLSADHKLPSKCAEYLGLQKPIIYLKYSQQDEFVDFFEGWEGLLDLTIEKNGKVGTEDFERWLAFLKHKAPVWPADRWWELAEKCRVETVGSAYLRLLSGNI